MVWLGDGRGVGGGVGWGGGGGCMFIGIPHHGAENITWTGHRLPQLRGC